MNCHDNYNTQNSDRRHLANSLSLVFLASFKVFPRAPKSPHLVSFQSNSFIQQSWKMAIGIKSVPLPTIPLCEKNSIVMVQQSVITLAFLLPVPSAA